MVYTESACKEVLLLIEKVNSYLLNDKRISISDISNLEEFLKHSVDRKINGKLSIKFHSKNQREDGTVIKLAETLIFDKNGFTIKSFSQEDYYGEYYTNNEFRISEDETEEYISEYIEAALKSIFIILKEINSQINIEATRFFITKRRHRL